MQSYLAEKCSGTDEGEHIAEACSGDNSYLADVCPGAPNPTWHDLT